MAYHLYELSYIVPEHKVRDPSADVKEDLGAGESTTRYGYRTVPARKIRVELNIDVQQILNQLAPKADRSKRKVSKAMAGAIKCKAYAK